MRLFHMMNSEFLGHLGRFVFVMFVVGRQDESWETR